MVIDRTKYMDTEEVKQLRRSTEARAYLDLKKGRVGGVTAWLLIDLALSTGLRVSEIAALQIKDVDLKRGCLSVTRLKRKKKARETLAIGKDLVKHFLGHHDIVLLYVQVRAQRIRRCVSRPVAVHQTGG